MDNNELALNAPESTDIVVRYEGPTVKDQAVSALVGVGITLAVSAAYIGTLALVGTVGSRINDYKSKKAAKKACETVENITTLETK